MPKFEIIPGGEQHKFYTNPGNSIESQCIGHLRFDSGSKGTEFWHSWFPHEADEIENDSEFKAEFNDLVEFLRKSALKGSKGAYKAIGEFGLPALDDSHYYGFHIVTERYLFHVRLFPGGGNYSYIYCYVNRKEVSA